MPTIIVENGTIVASANSWITLAEWTAYLALYGRVSTGTDDEGNVLLIKAQRAISTRLSLDGDTVSASQTTSLPRYWSRYIKGFAIGSGDIPQDFKDAQAELAWSIHEGADPLATRSAGAQGAITGSSSKAGPVEVSTTYADGGSSFDALSMSNYTPVMALLRPYLGAGASSHQVRLARA